MCMEVFGECCSPKESVYVLERGLSSSCGKAWVM